MRILTSPVLLSLVSYAHFLKTISIPKYQGMKFKWSTSKFFTRFQSNDQRKMYPFAITICEFLTFLYTNLLCGQRSIGIYKKFLSFFYFYIISFNWTSYFNNLNWLKLAVVHVRFLASGYYSPQFKEAIKLPSCGLFDLGYFSLFILALFAISAQYLRFSFRR